MMVFILGLFIGIVWPFVYWYFCPDYKWEKYYDGGIINIEHVVYSQYGYLINIYYVFGKRVYMSRKKVE